MIARTPDIHEIANTQLHRQETRSIVYCTLPPYVHLVSTRRDRCSQAFPVSRCFSVCMYYTKCKLKNKKQGRPENEAITGVCSHNEHPFVR